MNHVRFRMYGRKKLDGVWNVDYSERIHRIYKVHSGNGFCEANKKRIPFRKGHLYFIPQMADARLFTDPAQPIDHTYFGFWLYSPLMLEHVIELDLEQYPLIDNVMDFFTILFTENSSKSDSLQDIIYDQFNVLMSLLDHELHFQYVTDSRIVQALEFIHQNYNQQIEIEELSNRLHLDNSYFIRLFKKYMRVSPFQYLKDYRLSMAISLLKAGNKVSDVAEMVGYSSVHAFSNAVKKNMGISPSQLNQFY